MLLIGYGNQGRGDDGLGPAFTARVEEKGIKGLTIDTDFQLTVDHALMVSQATAVVFADASMNSEEPYSFEKISPVDNADIASHSLTPAAVLSLSKTLYGHAPEAFVLGISGSVFGDIREGLSEEAVCNLDLAEAFFLDWYSNRQG